MPWSQGQLEILWPRRTGKRKQRHRSGFKRIYAYEAENSAQWRKANTVRPEQFDSVHRIPTRSRDGRNSEPRPIIVKLSVFQDKNFIKSFIKNLPKGSNIRISDDFLKEVDEIRKKLYPVLKAAKREKKEAYFNVEKLLINGSLYRGPETFLFPFYGQLSLV